MQCPGMTEKSMKYCTRCIENCRAMNWRHGVQSPTAEIREAARSAAAAAQQAPQQAAAEAVPQAAQKAAEAAQQARAVPQAAVARQAAGIAKRGRLAAAKRQAAAKRRRPPSVGSRGLSKGAAAGADPESDLQVGRVIRQQKAEEQESQAPQRRWPQGASGCSSD